MLNGITFNNRNGSDTYDVNDVQSPSTLFDVTVRDRTDTARDKMEFDGVNPTLPYRGGMEIHIEGAIFADTSALYVTERKLLVAALFGDPNDAVDRTNRKHGTLVLSIEGETENWQTDCVVLAFTAPVRALYPALTEYAITLFSWTPYFVGSTSGNKYYWS